MSAEKLLFLHCKKGNLTELKRLVERKDVNLNVRDRWDSTPLYYACLCGHKEVVEYLLENGSKCEASTFDGERCVYGALTNEIRNILRSWKQIHSTVKRRDRHHELLRQMFEEDKTYKDISFDVHESKFGAHKCLLAARSAFFLEALSAKWFDKQSVVIKNDRVSPDAFRAMLEFLYLGRVDVPNDLIANLKRLASYCKLTHFHEEITNAEEKLAKLVHLKPSMGSKVRILTVESEQSFTSLSNDLQQLAESTLPVELRCWIDEGVLPFFDFNNNLSFYPDICVEVENLEFLCHKVFLCGHSDYFKALIADHFNESPKSTSRSDLPVIRLRHITADVFRHVVIYIYSGKVEFERLDEALDVLTTADLMLLPGLKRLCGNVLGDYLEEGNVVGMYRCAQTFNIPSLEDRCTSFMALELETLVEIEEFMNLVTEEAYGVKGREETDSIPIVDDIRYRITSAAATMGEIEESNAKLAKLDAMLARLGIEC